MPIRLPALLGQQTLTDMHVIFFMIGISLLMAMGFLGAFLWSMRSGQQDDLYTPAMRMLVDDNEPTTASTDTPV
ncbi:cbb3-type cytochrome oxidase assembly protein CcoS [Spirosoma pollinicola]